MSVCTLQAYTDELVELHRRLMALRERNVLQQVLGQSPPLPFVLRSTQLVTHESLGRGVPAGCADCWNPLLQPQGSSSSSSGVCWRVGDTPVQLPVL